MAKAKSPKLTLSFLTSLQICRPKKASSMIKSPLPRASHMLSPLNAKTFDISFPGTPIPPPSTPSSKFAPLPSTSRSSSSSQNKKDKTSKYKSKSKSWVSSSGDSSETESLFFSPPSLNTVQPLKPRRFKQYGSKEWREGEECNERKSMLGPCMKGKKVNQSFVVVKKSVDPYEDFKRSMSEMILEKEMFEPKELEQLLMSFLELNSSLHHRVIIEAFTEILKDVFCG